jgi:hypothetical protein
MVEAQPQRAGTPTPAPELPNRKGPTMSNPDGGARRTSRLTWPWCALVPLIVACSASDPAHQIERAASWAATTRELAIESGVGSIGRAYTLDLLDAGRKDIRKIETSLDSTKLPAAVRSQVPGALEQLDSVMTRAGDAIRRGNPGALGIAAEAADSLGHTLKSLGEQAGT